ncbi:MULTISPECIES: NAD(P)-dependent oxidoreductase [Bradyrhizobium]|uniref:NAD-dependent epimerase/dehydratase family protein n=1 Tax=Bradyrhizobium TaxID=374 RepID=UPI001FEDEDA8|nr:MULTISPECIES: NAD(P)-dependent oxidoreductase [Bradyrhizobium]MDN4988581.1 NAD-dependent epimerase/dehydratase family protein [Bradyrhizobium sp. WYCCWR 13022]
MSMQTPTPLIMRPTSFDQLTPIRNFSEVRATPATILRIAVDIAVIWLAFLLSWLAEGNHLNTLIPNGSGIIQLVGLSSLLACIAYMSAGLYNHHSKYNAWTKIGRIALINLGILLIATVIRATTGLSGPLEPHLIFTTVIGATALLSMARIGSLVLRSEDWPGSRLVTTEQPDETKVLVIGGGGYIGSALVKELLDGGLRVSVLDAMHFGEEPLARVAGHPNLTLIREDFRHIEALTRAVSGVGTVIHLGGLVGDPACAFDSDLTVDVNVTATKVIGEIAKARGVRRFIFASSCSVYGACDDTVNEDSHFNPQSLYARSKVASEAVLDALNSPDFSVTCLRFATIYGISGRTRFDLVVNLLCAKAVRDNEITVYGADQWRPFVHVEDVARAIVTTLRAPRHLVSGEAFNVGSDAQNYTLGDVAELIQKQVPDAAIISDDTFVDKRNYRVSFEKIRSRLGFTPAWTIESGIAQVVSVVRSNQVGDYSLPTYSNVLYLKEHGTKSFCNFKITGWEQEFMSLDHIDHIAPQDTIDRPAA